MSEPAPLSARNPKVQQLRRLLGRRRSREADGCFVLEGPLLVEDALTSGIEIEAVYLDEDRAAIAGSRDSALVDVAGERGIPWFVVAAGVLSGIGDTVTPQPVMAVARRADLSPAELVQRAASRLIVVLAGVSDPGNAGTLLRSIDASGGGGMIFAGGSVDPYNPKVVRSSAGSICRVPLAVCGSVDDGVSTLADSGYSVAGAVAQGGLPPDELDLTERVAVVLGNEARGLPENIALDERVTIPIDGDAESINVAMAGTVICFEAARQRRIQGPA